jgi:hypothetical protein
LLELGEASAVSRVLAELADDPGLGLGVQLAVEIRDDFLVDAVRFFHGVIGTHNSLATNAPITT